MFGPKIRFAENAELAESLFSAEAFFIRCKDFLKLTIIFF
jgi:hypothetical protein